MLQPALPTAHSAPQIPPLDGIRGLSALVVVIAHASRLGLLPPVPGGLSSYAVMVFFILSGFLMGHLYLGKPCDPATGSDYVAARIARIVPLYYGIVLLSWLIYNYIDSSFFYAMTNAALVRHLLFTGSVSYFWSIGPEMQFYAVFLLLWWSIIQGRKGDWRPLTLLLLTSCLIFLFQPLFPGITVFSKLHIFLAGVGLALLHRVLAPALTGGRLILAVQIGILVLCLLAATVPAVHQRFFAGDPHDVLINAFYGDARRVMFSALIVFAFSFETALADALFANRLMRHLGACSFSIYLLHGPVLWSLDRTGVFAQTGPTLGFLVALMTIYLVSWVSFTLIERPSQRRLRKPLAARLDALATSWFSSPASPPAVR